MLTTFQFINNGLQCITDMLRDVPLQPANLADCIQRAGQLLRVLAHVTESIREEAAMLPQLEAVVQDKFIDAICTKFNAIHSTLAADSGKTETEIETSQLSQALVFLARLLQFDLGFRGVWTAKTKEASNQLVSTLFRLALVGSTPFIAYLVIDHQITQIHGSGKHIDLVAYPLIVDTLYYVLDGMFLTFLGTF